MGHTSRTQADTELERKNATGRARSTGLKSRIWEQTGLGGVERERSWKRRVENDLTGAIQDTWMIPLLTPAFVLQGSTIYSVNLLF